MCRRARCATCGRPTYAGCGRHVEQVLGDVPLSERCQCAANGRQVGARRAGRSWLGSRLRGAGAGTPPTPTR